MKSRFSLKYLLFLFSFFQTLFTNLLYLLSNISIERLDEFCLLLCYHSYQENPKPDHFSFGLRTLKWGKSILPENYFANCPLIKSAGARSHHI